MTNNKIVSFLFNEIVYNAHLQSASASAVVFLTAHIMGIPIDYIVLFLVYLSFQFIYMNDRRMHIGYDVISNKERTEHLSKYLSHIPLLLVAIFLAIVAGFVYISDYRGLLFMLSVLFLGLLYPIYFKWLTAKIFSFKSYYVALVYAVLTVLPFVSGGFSVFNRLFVFLFILFAMESLIGQIAFDYKDIKSDSTQGLRTFPVVLGRKKTFKILIYTNALVSILYIFCYQIIGTWFLVLILVNLLMNVFSLIKIFNNNRMGYIILASKFVLWVPLVLLLE